MNLPGEFVILMRRRTSPHAAPVAVRFSNLAGRFLIPMQRGPLPGSAAPVAAKYVNSAGKFVILCGSNFVPP